MKLQWEKPDEAAKTYMESYGTNYWDDLIQHEMSFEERYLGTPDNGVLRNLYNETVCMAFPEAIKDMLKSDF